MGHKVKLYCDVDNTINLHWKRIRRFTVNGVCDYSKANSYEEVLKDEVLDGSVEAITELSKKYQIHFLTARNYHRAFEVTKEWLDKHKFPYSSIIVVSGPEQKLAHLNDETVFIDDLSRSHEKNLPYHVLYTEVIKKVKDTGTVFELFHNNWNDIVNRLTK